MRNHVTAMLGLWLLTATLGCGVDYTYDAEEYARKVAPLEKGAAVVDVIDSRPLLTDPEDAAEDLEGLKEAVHEHLVLDGVIAAPGQLKPTPKSAADVEAILNKAAAEGTPQVMFLSWRAAGMRGYRISLAGFAYLVGFIPWIIVDSLPISRHAGDSIFAAIVVDPKTKEVLYQATPLGAYGEKVNAWGWSAESIMRKVTGATLQRALEDVAAARKAGFPDKRAVADLGKFVMAWPENRMEGQRLRGVGYSIQPPEGWTFDEERVVVRPAEGKTKLVVVHFPTLLREDDQLEELKETMADPDAEQLSPRPTPTGAAVRKLASVKDSKADGHPALDLVFKSGKTIEIERRVPVHGWQLSFVCEGPETEKEALDTCAKTFDSVDLDIVTVPD